MEEEETGRLDADSLFLNDLFGDGLVSDPMLGTSDSITPPNAAQPGAAGARGDF
eukprot:CAMPEP_0169469142 /NCGR_PEP_ID=MMETSP1042-20121227/23314_1 /TAXON_ID=464988 /ORGANISM="Hemiselmis andersenii, Strain CCMP1180" /LENGTH=53 /DNA_ID=CAMNT_0009582583 /DNA_START=245 /DNA_END=403 /DNA_ORIENTATION=-